MVLRMRMRRRTGGGVVSVLRVRVVIYKLLGCWSRHFARNLGMF
jgi:hypothetical protein